LPLCAYAQLKSEAWLSLSGAAVKVWLELHTRYNGGNNGRLHLSLNEAAKILGLGKATVQRAYVELTEKGFLVLEVEGNWYSRRAHDWRLTTKPMERFKGKEAATFDFRHWKQPRKAKHGPESDPS
jgi:DNA-binding transcriptional MocR family regulator